MLLLFVWFPLFLPGIEKDNLNAFKGMEGSGEQIQITQFSFKYAWTFLNRWKIFKMFDNCITKEVLKYKWNLPIVC